MDVKEAIRILEDSVGLGSADLAQAIGFAVYELSKEVPRQPVTYSIGLGGIKVCCPNCESWVYHSEWTDKTKLDYFTDRCKCCGQLFTPKGRLIGHWEPEGGEADD